MPQIRSLLKDASVEVAERRRTCHRNRRNGHCIAKGQTCLVIVDDLGGKKNYCAACAADILAKVEADLHALRAALEDEAP